MLDFSRSEDDLGNLRDDESGDTAAQDFENEMNK